MIKYIIFYIKRFFENKKHNLNVYIKNLVSDLNCVFEVKNSKKLQKDLYNFFSLIYKDKNLIEHPTQIINWQNDIYKKIENMVDSNLILSGKIYKEKFERERCLRFLESRIVCYFNRIHSINIGMKYFEWSSDSDTECEICKRNNNKIFTNKDGDNGIFPGEHLCRDKNGNIYTYSTSFAKPIIKFDDED